MTNQQQPQPKKESISSVILKVVLILIGVLLVLVIGIWLGTHLQVTHFLKVRRSYRRHRHPAFLMLWRTFMSIFAAGRAQNIRPFV